MRAQLFNLFNHPLCYLYLCSILVVAREFVNAEFTHEPHLPAKTRHSRSCHFGDYPEQAQTCAHRKILNISISFTCTMFFVLRTLKFY